MIGFGKYRLPGNGASLCLGPLLLTVCVATIYPPTSSTLAAAAAVVTTAPPPRPNLIVILQDDLGFRDTGINGASGIPTGNISALAQSGVVFDRHYVHWHCSPTRRSFISGRLPIHHGEQLSGVSTDDIDMRWTWISEKLAGQGYKCHWYGKGHTGYISTHQLPINRGFAEGHLG